MLELAWKGTKPLKMSDGTERKFINDGDTVIMKGYCENNGIRVGFGEVKGKILPAK
jgi:fumarylacetoacetase